MAKNKAQIQDELDEAKAELDEATAANEVLGATVERLTAELAEAQRPSDANWDSCLGKLCVATRRVQGLATFNTIDQLLVESMK
ncbi:hypothetical protein LCGC14_1349220 [marine sediment metagenome]|uniref:Uncharacterized protein n=1 Tax=marine sediment metagenome TaxID=412755 RepID=A0A0F9MS83_9ZZZZ